MPDSGYKARLLLVEDEALIAMDVEERLRRLKYDVCAVASTAQAAVQLAAIHRPHLVIMDIRLAESSDGVRAANDIHQLVGIPHVYLTSYTDRATLARAKATRPLGYLLKPFSDQDLNTTIDVALYRDRTERKITEHREWRDSLFRSIDDAVVAVDEQGRVRSLNAAAETLTGFCGTEALGKPITSIWPRTASEQLLSKDAGEDTLTLIGDTAERTQRRTQILATARAGCMARAAARLAHSFNDQLTVLANAGGQATDGMHTLPDQIAMASNALNDLVSELHMLAHPHAPNREPVDVNELVEDCTANVIRSVVPQTVEVDLECSASNAMTFVDRAHVQEALLDLVVTLRNNTSPSQMLSIRTETIEEGLLGSGKGRIAIFIADTTMHAARLNGRKWNPIAARGALMAGLEQKTAEDLIRENGGVVEQLAGAADGMMFRILLPHLRPFPQTQSAVVSRASDGIERKRRVLVVDDSSEIRHVIGAILVAEGYEVMDAGSAEEAVSLLANSTGGIDVLVTDVVLPCLSGADLADRLSRENPSLAVVLMSGYTHEQLSSLRPRVEKAVFLAKPFTPKQLMSIIGDSDGVRAYNRVAHGVSSTF
ncbi:MAG TPA: response regulator [Bryobacteraceae bacterium]|nr:response regulator [Bryobacteraceae bacterium]